MLCAHYKEPTWAATTLIWPSDGLTMNTNELSYTQRATSWGWWTNVPSNQSHELYLKRLCHVMRSGCFSATSQATWGCLLTKMCTKLHSLWVAPGNLIDCKLNFVTSATPQACILQKTQQQAPNLTQLEGPSSLHAPQWVTWHLHGRACLVKGSAMLQCLC